MPASSISSARRCTAATTRIDVVGSDDEDPNIPREPIVVAGPLCESGDVFTRDDRELLAPRMLPRPEAGDLLTLRDAGAYGYAMVSNYNSIGRAPQLWLEEDGTVRNDLAPRDGGRRARPGVLQGALSGWPHVSRATVGVGPPIARTANAADAMSGLEATVALPSHAEWSCDSLKTQNQSGQP